MTLEVLTVILLEIQYSGMWQNVRVPLKFSKLLPSNTVMHQKTWMFKKWEFVYSSSKVRNFSPVLYGPDYLLNEVRDTVYSWSQTSMLVLSWEQLSRTIPLSKTFTIHRKFIASVTVNAFEIDRKHFVGRVHFSPSLPLHQKLATIQATTLYYKSKRKQQTFLASRLSKTKSHNNFVPEILRPWSSGMWGHIIMQMVMLVRH
jgi:hypothetical protein